jgi:hypothetical protein
MFARATLTRSLVAAAVAASVVVCALAPSAGAAYPKKKYCGNTSAVGRTMKVAILNPFRVRISYSCATAKGLMRKYARTRPSRLHPNRVVLFGGRRWACYYASDRSGYSCNVAGASNFRVPSVRADFL